MGASSPTTPLSFSLSSLNFHHPHKQSSYHPTFFFPPKPKHLLAQTPSALPELLSTTTTPTDPTTLAVLGGGSVAALAAVITLTDPEKRRQQQAVEVGGGDKEVVREYFNGTGFQRWKKIYGDTDDVNKVQLDIRIGHAKTVESTLQMLADEGSLKGVTVCDAGCGTGSLSIPLAKQGAVVFGSDISAAMVSEAETKLQIVVTLSNRVKRKQPLCFRRGKVAYIQASPLTPPGPEPCWRHQGKDDEWKRKK